MGGFECSTHRRFDGQRIDCVASTRHDEFARADYQTLQNFGMRTARDGVRWHLCERRLGHYEWDSALRQVRAARETGMQVIWDVFHYGWPDDINIFGPRFVDSLARFSGAFARLLREESDEVPLFAPVNEMSFMSWIGGDAGFFAPYSHARGDELKQQLARACIHSIQAVREVFPGARIVHPEPLVNVVPADDSPRAKEDAWWRHQSQFWALDMICGRDHPELGGREEFLDIVGANYYSYNQWRFPGGPGTTVTPSDPGYRPLSNLLGELWGRFGRPILLSETGIEFEARAPWLHYIGGEARAAIKQGIQLEGVCWYPIVNHPGWDDDRHCQNGLWDYPNERGERRPDPALEAEFRVQMALSGADREDKRAGHGTARSRRQGARR